MEKTLLVLLLFFLPGTYGSDCHTGLKVLAEPISDLVEERVNDQVSVIWYPRAGYVALSHVDLAVSGNVWKGVLIYRDHTTENAIVRTAVGGGKGFFRFRLSVTPKELENLQHFLEANEGKPSFHMCSGSACRALYRGAGIWIPYPLAAVPTLTALYLTVTKTLGYRRIHSIEYVGKGSALRALVSTEVPYELWVSYMVGGAFLVQATNWAGQLVNLVVPVSEEDENKNQDKATPEAAPPEPIPPR